MLKKIYLFVIIKAAVKQPLKMTIRLNIQEKKTVYKIKNKIIPYRDILFVYAEFVEKWGYNK
mgnify:CR=1 FL=1